MKNVFRAGLCVIITGVMLAGCGKNSNTDIRETGVFESDVSLEADNNEISDFYGIPRVTETKEIKRAEKQDLIDEVKRINLNKDLTEEDIEELWLYTWVVFHIQDSVDISLISRLENLEKLAIHQGDTPNLFETSSRAYISDFSFLNNMQIKKLEINFSDKDIILNGINLPQLEELEINCAKIIDDEIITSFPNLKNLYIGHSDVESIAPFCGMDLERMSFYNTNFKEENSDSINDIITLVDLAFAFTNISFSTLSGLTKLEYLYLQRIPDDFDFEMLFELTWLRALNLEISPPEGFIERYKEANPTVYTYWF
ncbi:MAG: hypothetical protein FWG70_05850 [Oscillospiraceae bacterium]|nr:hypothetical protein [Oscillospiraceae bacterium]